MNDCEGCRVSRRSFLGSAGAASLAFGGGFGFLRRLLAQEKTGKGAKACILLWMSGGPSQIDTFDPKPGMETGGEFKALETPVKGMKIAEPLPRLAKEARRFSIVRNLVSPEGDHARASYLLHTGYPQLEASPHPAAGSMFSHELSKNPESPQYVAIGSGGYGPAYLGYPHAPFVVGDPASALATIQAVGDGRRRIDLMNALQEKFVKSHGGDAQERREAMVKGMARLMDTPFAKALDLSEEKEELKAAYGAEAFGQACLLARRLVERGVKFVEVELGGWDTHSENFDGVRELCKQVDPAFSTLLRDLDARGLLKETVVLWMGEFGRTPTVNANNGRDHFPNVTPVAVAGGPIQGGRVIGGTDNAGREVVGAKYKVADLFATLYRACGIDTNKKFFNREGKLAKPTDNGVAIKDLMI